MRLGIILAYSSIYNKIFNRLNLKDKNCLFYVEDTIYSKGEYFFDTLKDDVNAVMYINQDDYIIDIVKSTVNNVLSKEIEKCNLPFESITIPFNMTKEILSKLENEINKFYKENKNE